MNNEFNSYFNFSKFVIHELEKDGFSKEFTKKNIKCKRKYFDSTNIELVFPGRNAYRSNRESRIVYDCEIKFISNDNGRSNPVSFIDICEDILLKVEKDKISQPYLHRILKTAARQPLFNVETYFPKEYIHFSNLNAGFKIQDFVDIISFIALIEEFNYPLRDSSSYSWRGRNDCFGRYVEVLMGGRDEFNQIKHTLFTKKIHFEINPIYSKYYFSEIINEDRLFLQDFKKI